MPDFDLTVLAEPLGQLAYFVVLAAAGVAIRGLHLVAAKVKLQISAEQQAKLELLAKRAALYAEEEAAARLRAYAKQAVAPPPALPSPHDSANKLASAVSALMLQVPSITESEARQMVISVLPELGIGAAHGAHAGKAPAGVSA